MPRAEETAQVVDIEDIFKTIEELINRIGDMNDKRYQVLLQLIEDLKKRVVEGRLRVASVQQKSPSVDSIITRLWSFYSTIEKTSTDNALRELYNIMSDINHFIVHLVELKPTEAFLRDRLVKYEKVIEEHKNYLVALIRLKHYYRARDEILKLIDILQSLAKEEELFSVELKASPSAGHSSEELR